MGKGPEGRNITKEFSAAGDVRSYRTSPGLPNPSTVDIGLEISVVGCCLVHRGMCNSIPGLCPLEARSTSLLGRQKMSLDIAKFFPAWEESCPVENHRTCHSIGFGTVNTLSAALTLAKAEALRMYELLPAFLPSSDNQHGSPHRPSQRQNHLPLNEGFDCYQFLKAVSEGSASNIYGVYEMAPEHEWFY